jgi:hypothetical protein
MGRGEVFLPILNLKQQILTSLCRVRTGDQESHGFEVSPGKKFLRPYFKQNLDEGAHACHSSYAGDWDLKESGSKPAQAKEEIYKSPSQQENLGVVLCACLSPTAQRINKLIMVQAGPGKK